MSRRLRAIAAETVAVVERGGYRSPSGPWVDISGDVRAAIAGTRHYLPGMALPEPGPSNPTPDIEVTAESTLAAGRRLGGGTAALVFASARKPGGGFLTGARAQEEDVARASALHACLITAPEFYAFHRAHSDLRYSDRVIYSPDVPVFRDDAHVLLEDPYRVSFITAAAPNLQAVRRNQPDRIATVPAAVRARAERVLAVAAAHGHHRLVLGAWGCGVFGNEPAVVAGAWSDALHRVPHFDRVVFAVLDRAPATPTLRTFADILGRG